MVMDEHGGFIEIQGTAEGETFSGDELMQMLELGKQGIREIFDIQKQAIGS